MRIKQRLKLAALTPVIMTLAIGVALLVSGKTLRTAQSTDRIAQEIVKNMEDLDNFTRLFLIYHEKRPKQQFLAKHDSTMHLIATLSLISQEEQIHLDDLLRDCEAMGGLFRRLVSNYEGSRSARDPGLLREAEERLVGQLLIRSRGVISRALSLQRIADDRIAAAQQRASTLIIITILAAAALLTLGLILTVRMISRSLAALQKGTEAIGAGHLGYRTGLTTGDELGDLSKSFDFMTERLQAATVSKAKLEQEVEERKKAENAARESNVLLQERNSELDSFNYSVSHDLRGPLRAISGFAHILEKNHSTQLDEEGRSHLQRISKASQRMAQIIDDLLTLSRITRVEIRRTQVDLAQLARGVADELAQGAPQRDAEFAIPTAMRVWADSGLMRIAVENLLRNAWKFSSKRPRTRIELSFWEDERGLVFCVRDNGTGFDTSLADKLFLPFQRLHANSDFEGTGIGLAIVRRVVERHGGKVWAESTEDAGAAFFFSVPNKIRDPDKTKQNI